MGFEVSFPCLVKVRSKMTTEKEKEYFLSMLLNLFLNPLPKDSNRVFIDLGEDGSNVTLELAEALWIAKEVTLREHTIVFLDRRGEIKKTLNCYKGIGDSFSYISDANEI